MTYMISLIPIIVITYVYLSLLPVSSDMYTIELFMIMATDIYCNYNDCHFYELLLLHKARFFVLLVNINKSFSLYMSCDNEHHVFVL